MKRELINASRHQGQLQDILSQLERINSKIKKNIESECKDDIQTLIDDVKHKIEKL